MIKTTKLLSTPEIVKPTLHTHNKKVMSNVSTRYIHKFVQLY